MLFLEEPLTLPIVGVKLPLIGFFIVGPAVYLVIHAYMLVMLVLLARSASTLDDALAASRQSGQTDRQSERFRIRIENSLFAQVLVGAKPERSGITGVVLRAIAIVTLAIGPILLLLLFQLMFLPYHSEIVTWWHRAADYIFPPVGAARYGFLTKDHYRLPRPPILMRYGHSPR